MALRRTNRPGQAITEVREALDLLDPLVKKYPDVESYRLEMANAHLNLRALSVSRNALEDARTAYSAAVRSYESLAEPTVADIYNLACAQARLIVLDRENQQIHQARALSALQRTAQARYPNVETLNGDPDLEPLRGLPFFQEILFDLKIPANPFQ